MKAVSKVLMAVLVGCVLSSCKTPPPVVEGPVEVTPVEDRLLTNSQGYNITVPTTKELENQPKWVLGWDNKLMWDEGDGDDKTFHVIAKSTSDYNGNQKDGWQVLINTTARARMIARDLIAYYVSFTHESAAEDYYKEVEYDGTVTTESIWKDKSSSMTTTKLQGIKDGLYFHEQWEHAEGSQASEYYICWMEFTISYRDIADARKIIDDKNVAIEVEKAYFPVLQAKYYDALNTVKSFKVDTVESEFITYSLVVEQFGAIENELKGLKYFKDGDKQIDKKLLGAYVTLGQEITKSKKEYSPTKSYRDYIERKNSEIGRLELLVANMNSQLAKLKNEKDDLKVQYAQDLEQTGRNYSSQLEKIEEDHRKKLENNETIMRELRDDYRTIAAAFKSLQGSAIPVFDDIMSKINRIRVTPEMKNIVTARKNGKVRKVNKGEYLAQIAYEWYGYSFYYPFIYQVNLERIPSRDPNVIRQGIELVLPDLPPEIRPDRLFNTPKGQTVAYNP